MDELSHEVQAYAAYLNAPREHLDMDADQTTEFDEDLAKARAAMERAWLEWAAGGGR